MIHNQPPLAIVRAWQEKSSEASVRSSDHLFSAVSKGFDAMAALLAKNSDPVYVQKVLAYLNVDRTIALQFDNAKDDSLRDIVYGLLESLHVSLNEWNEERNQRKETGEIFTQTEEYTIPFLGPVIASCEISLPMDNQTSNNLSTLTNPSPIIPIEPKEELIDIHHSLPQDYQISASELMRDEEMIMKEEIENQYSVPISPDSLDGISTAADFTRSLLPFNPREEPRDQTVPQDNQIPSLLFPPQEAVPIGFVDPSENMSTMGNFTPSNPKIKKEEPVETQEVHNYNEIGSRDFMEEQNNNVDTSDSNAKVEMMKRSSIHVPRPTQYAESMDHSDDDGGPSMKKLKSHSTSKADNRASIKGEDKSESGRKKLTVSKENATELECPECSYSTRIVKTWLNHLSKKHSTTPSLAGFALLCECGHESLSEAHSLICNRGNTTVIRKRDGPIGRLDDEKITPQCVHCEVYPKTAYGYAKHLDTHHKSTLAQNGIYLLCSCGVEVRSTHNPKHTEDCNPRQFSLREVDDE